jgi:dihydrofolate reductase
VTHLTYSINVTLNGCCDHTLVIADEEHHLYAMQLLSWADVLLLGRHTFELFEDFWPGAAKRTDLPHHIIQFARALEDKKKYIVTRRPLQTQWNNSFVLSGNLSEQLSAWGDNGSSNILVWGSPGLGRSLLELKKVDEMHLLLQPIAASGEPKLFDGLSAPARFSLEGVDTFKSGVAVLRYKAMDHQQSINGQ